jgi:hypothetical protein
MNIQDEVQKIHHQYGTSEMANYEIQKLFDKQQERNEEDLKTAWNSSAQNMRFTFSSSAYRNISFEQWFEQFKNE